MHWPFHNEKDFYIDHPNTLGPLALLTADRMIWMKTSHERSKRLTYALPLSFRNHATEKRLESRVFHT